MSPNENINVITKILETHEGRDKFLKTFSYAAKLATLFTKSSETAKKINRFGSKMSECRVILRLMDDIPILQETISYGWGRQERCSYTRLLKSFRNLVDIIASPVEHISWAGEQKFITTDEYFWDNLSTRLWIVSLCLSLWISLRSLIRIEADIDREPREYKRIGNEERLKKMDIMYEKRNNQMLTCLRLSLDLSYAISYLPSGYIRLKTWQVGLLGTLSSMIGIYQLFKRHGFRI